MSDIHHEFFIYDEKIFPEQDGEVLILAGDIMSLNTDIRILWFEKYIEIALQKFKHVIMVAGNHEFYGADFLTVISILNQMDKRYNNFHFLNHKSIKIGGVNFIGATLWSSPSYASFASINDGNYIRLGNLPFNYNFLCELNSRSKDFIREELENKKSEKNVVVTHFGPDPYLCPDEYKSCSNNDYYFSSGFQYHFHHANLWLFGHTHASIDTKINGCRFVTNPRGYAHELNKNYSSNKIIII